MAAMRIDRAPFVNYNVPAGGHEAAELYNNEIARLCRVAPDRFGGGWAYLPMQDQQAAAGELRPAINELKLTGGYLPSNVTGYYLDDERLAPVFAAAAELDVPLFCTSVQSAGARAMAHYELAVVVGYLFDTSLNIFHMIFGGLFDKYPKLRMCCTHLDGYAPLLCARMQRKLDTNPALAASPEETVSRLFPLALLRHHLFRPFLCASGRRFESRRRFASASR
jgi:aminocarboxymuconate-semialdehyde decarboxylase